MKTKSLHSHRLLFDSLSKLIVETENKIRKADDSYFTDNANYFCKSFLITICTYLEAYLKEVALIIIVEADARLKQNKIASNIIKWSIDKSKDGLKMPKYEPFTLNIAEKDVDDNLSGNVDRTLAFFRKLGIDLDSNTDFVLKKDIIAPIIVKRNNIIHYNDDASDLSLGDLQLIIEDVFDYILVIDNSISAHIHPCLTDPFAS